MTTKTPTIRGAMPSHRESPLLNRRDAATIAVAVCLAVIFPGAVGRAQSGGADVKGATDHPLISRYTGSRVVGYDVRQFDEFVLPLGPVPNETPTKTQRVEGKVTRILYMAPEARSSLEVMSNYQGALKGAGFQTVFQCVRVECGGNGSQLAKNFLYRKERHLVAVGELEYALSFPGDERYVAMKLSRAAGDVYVSLLVETEDATGPWTSLRKRTLTLLEVIETKPLETGMVTVDAAAMARDINATGHIALYGVHFDTNSAVIKPDSEPSLQEIGKLLKQDPQLKLYVVGHTDNVGGYEPNITLSQQRAESVVKALVSKQGVDVRRLRATASDSWRQSPRTTPKRAARKIAG